MWSDEWYVIENVEIVQKTRDAILIEGPDLEEDEDYWVPLSLLEEDSIMGLGEEGDVVVQRWWAKKKGLT